MRAASMLHFSEHPISVVSASSVQLSPQQQAVVNWVKTGQGSAFVEAVAGSGKTSTLVAACRTMRGQVAFTAFNKAIADEIGRKVNAPNVKVATFHSFGFAAWRQVTRGVVVDGDRKYRLMCDELNIPWHLKVAVSRLVSVAKQSAVGVLWKPDNLEMWDGLVRHYDIMLRVEDSGSARLARRAQSRIGFGADVQSALDNDWDNDAAVMEVVKLAQDAVAWSQEIGRDLIDFDDMVWLPLLENAPFKQHDWVLVDEAQDTNVVRRLMAERMVKRSGRTLWVGDRNQAIYGFSGASSDAVDQVITHYKCQLLPLTVTFRCSKAATEMAQRYVPQITAHEANQQGSVTGVTKLIAKERYVWGLPKGDEQHSHEHPLGPGDAVLCRNTKPLVVLAFELLRAGKGCHVEGRDIGKSIEALINKWKSVQTVEDLYMRLEEYRLRETAKLTEKGEGSGPLIERLNDRIDTVLAIADGAETLNEIRSRVRSLFQDTDGSTQHTILLATVHRAKGREWNRVFVLGWGDYMPSKRATQDWERQQERNLVYVAVTRTRRDLVLLPALDK